ncbi:hypothetical protein Bca52824_090527 [Brassica carinata]|uniref:MCAfunc domain-containing protein n=1 Tax=Brassica carinata TaxID=52824 RepID=A0A8X7TGE2_BRACI|nr:hypothetical protein Bca52824_090527 [Brassica carinata]
MSHSWDGLGEIASVAQLTGLDAVKLIGLIVKAANTAWMHKKNCRQFAQHLKLIGNLLEQLKISEMKKYPETREPLEGLEDALRRSYILVNSCRDRSYLYLLAMGWNIVYQFRKAQEETPLQYKNIQYNLHIIAWVNNTRRMGEGEIDEHFCLPCSSSGSYCLTRSFSRFHVSCLPLKPIRLKTFFFPCGTLAKIATAATNRHISSAEACNELMAYSLILSCCCYTCCVRRKLRKTLNITGGFIDDFLSHLMCCCCALVQELREVEIRGAYGTEKTKISPPSSQFMEH